MERLAVLEHQICQKEASKLFTDDQFSHIAMAPADPILGTAIAYAADKDPSKMNLGVGAYRTDAEKPYVFNVVRKVEKEILQDLSLNKEYPPIDGLPEFNTAAARLLLGADSPAIKEKRLVTIQTLSGTGALRIGAHFFQKHRNAAIYVSKPTWANHPAIFNHAGLTVKEYPYFDDKTKSLNFEGMIQGLSNAESGAIILLHVCAHNPTGVDPTQDQWREIARVMKAKSLFPFFDSAYQGFATGDLDADVFPVRHFIEEGFQMLICQSLAKNMGLYGERIGALHFVTKSPETAAKVLSQAKILARVTYSNPPLHGARIASRILNNKENFAEWKAELEAVAGRILAMRKALYEELVALKTPGKWTHITSQIGMFSYTGLTEKQCETLINKYHIYMLKNGRISMPGINVKNVKYLAAAIKDAVTNS